MTNCLLCLLTKVTSTVIGNFDSKQIFLCRNNIKKYFVLHANNCIILYTFEGRFINVIPEYRLLNLEKYCKILYIPCFVLTKF